MCVGACACDEVGSSRNKSSSSSKMRSSSSSRQKRQQQRQIAAAKAHHHAVLGKGVLCLGIHVARLQQGLRQGNTGATDGLLVGAAYMWLDCGWACSKVA